MTKAVVFSEYGAQDVLRLVDIDTPQPGPGQVRLRVQAAGVQPFDALFHSGAAAQWAPAHFPQQLGNEAAGVIDAVGPGVTSFAIGEEVLGWVMLAAFAEHAVVGTDQIVRKPPSLPWSQAGALSASGQTAHTALRSLGVGAGDTVLIHAASGGVGHLAVQMAVAWGARVLGTASERNHDFLRSLGALPVTYGEGLAGRVPGLVDAALDCVATEESLRASLALVKDPARIGTVAFNPLAGELGVRQLSTERSQARLTELVELHSAGRLRVTVQETYPLSRAAEALREVAGGHVRGKVIITGDL